MTQEEKDLLLKDLCSRLPYGVMVKYGNRNTPVKCDLDCHPSINDLENIKIYLRPMSSMTEIEKEELRALKWTKLEHYTVDWLNVHHFDYRGLIEEGLALEAPEGMYNN